MSAIGSDDPRADAPSDEALLAGMAVGSAAATTAFVHRHQPRVSGMARALVGDPGLAEEVAQDAFVRAWREGARFDARKGTVGAWLSAITRNLAIDRLRKRRAEPVDPQTFLTLTATDGDPIDQVTRREDMHRVGTALQELPRAQRRALLLAVFFDRTAAEVSRMEQIPLGTAKTRIRTAILKLRATLSQPLQARYLAAACAAGASPVRTGCPASTTRDWGREENARRPALRVVDWC